MLILVRLISAIRSRGAQPLQPQAVIERLNHRFRLGLAMVPSRRACITGKIISASQRKPFFLSRLSKSLKLGDLTKINGILKSAGLKIVEVGEHHRIQTLEKRSILNRGKIFDLNFFSLEPVPVTTNGLNVPIERGEDKLSLSIFASGQGRKIQKLAKPTKAEYLNNELMRKAIEEKMGEFLKDPTKGLRADNIAPNTFYKTYFTCKNREGEKKGFTGSSLLLKRGMERTKRDMVSLLKELGIEVRGELPLSALPTPTPKEYADSELMRKAIEEKAGEFLKDPTKGFRTDNIAAARFSTTNFVFEDGKGEKKSFAGVTLLMKREIGVTKRGVVSLLRELGIEVRGELPLSALPTPTQGEYADNELIRTAILKGTGKFLKDPKKGITAKNIRSQKFFRAEFVFEDKEGKKKRFVGQTLLLRRKKHRKTGEIVSLLKELGIKVRGEASRPTTKEYADNELILRAIKQKLLKLLLEGRLDEVLIDPKEGLTADNIRLDRFPQMIFTFENKNGEKKEFAGEDLLRERGAVPLLRELGLI